LNDRRYAVAFRRGGVEGRRTSTNRLFPVRGGKTVGACRSRRVVGAGLFPVRGGKTVGVAPGGLAAAGGNRDMWGGFASPHPSTAYVL